MKRSAITSTCGVWVLILAASSVWAAVYQERDDFHRSLTLSAKAHVAVSGISGSLDVKAIDGDMAIVQIERTARSRAELDCNKVVLEQVADNLAISFKTVGPGCQVIQVVHRVQLSLPGYVDLSVEGVSGPVNIGEIEGILRIRGNSGHIDLAQPGRGSRITGNSGTITVKLRNLDAGGLELNGNSGSIKLYVDNEVDVDVQVSGHGDPPSSEVPNATFNRIGAADYHVRIGSGGPTVKVKGHSGSVLLSRYRE